MTSPGTSDPTGPIIVTVVAVALVWVLAFVLMCSMIFRSFALLILAATAPVALMLMPWEHTMSWTRRWCETVVALLIAKPLAATVLAVAVRLFANSTSFAGLASGAVGMLLACAAPLMALKLVSFAGGELAAAAQVAGGGHVLSRGGSFAARQVSRQVGGKLSLASMASHKPALVQSSAEPTLKGLQAGGKSSGLQNVKNDGGQPVPSAGNQPPGSETKTYGQPYIKRAGTPHRDPNTPNRSPQPASGTGSNRTPVGGGSPPSPAQQHSGPTGVQRAPRPVQKPAPPVQAPKPQTPEAPRPVPQAPQRPVPRPPRINPERDKDV